MARVLLLEDEPSIARIIAFKLEREGHVVRVEEELGRGIEAATEFEPDLVLLEAAIADDRVHCLARARGGRGLVVLVDAGDTRTPEWAPGAGAVAVVRKPFKPTVLARLVRQLTTAPEASHR